MSQVSAVWMAARLTDGRVALVAGLEVAQELLAPGHQPVGVRGVEVVDELVGVAGEAVEGVHVRPLGRGEQQRGQVVGAAVGGVEAAARLVGRPQRRVGDPGRVQLPPAHRRDLPQSDAGADDGWRRASARRESGTGTVVLSTGHRCRRPSTDRRSELQDRVGCGHAGCVSTDRPDCSRGPRRRRELGRAGPGVGARPVGPRPGGGSGAVLRPSPTACTCCRHAWAPLAAAERLGGYGLPTPQRRNSSASSCWR